MTKGLGQKILNFYGLGLKIAILYFLALSLTSQKIFKCCRKQRLKVLDAVADRAKFFKIQ